MVTRTDIRRAFKQFESGRRPPTYGTPKAWYVRDDRTGRLYPLKAIWALAQGDEVRTRDFNTSDPIALMPSLDFEIVHSPSTKIETSFQDEVKASIADSSAARRKRLAKATKKPAFYIQQIKVFVRNPDVVAEALFQAKGTCGSCGSEAPFERRSDRTPYLEVHHVKPLVDGGLDTLENVVALCPNCHRKAHFG